MLDGECKSLKAPTCDKFSLAKQPREYKLCPDFHVVKGQLKHGARNRNTCSEESDDDAFCGESLTL
jgi:hypothetical protein